MLKDSRSNELKVTSIGRYPVFLDRIRIYNMTSKSVTENHLKTGGESLDFQNKIEVTNKVSEACYETFQAMKLRRKHRYIIFKLGEEEIEVESTGERKSVRFILSSFSTLC